METKPSIYTSEFWVLILGTIATLLNQFGVWDYVSNWHSGVVWAVLAAAYQVSRGFAKSGVSADPTVPANKKAFLSVRKRDVTNRG